MLRRLRAFETELRLLLRTRAEALSQRCRDLPQTVRSEVRRRGTDPKAGLGDWRDWINHRRKRFWYSVAFLTYCLLGFVILPWVARREIVSALETSFDRPASLDRLRINPFLLSADLRGFRLTEKDGSPLGGFERLYVRLELSSVLRFAWCFHAVILEGLNGDIIRYTKSDTNIGRLLSTPDGTSETPERKRGLPRVVIGRLEIKNSTLTYTDHLPSKAFHTVVGPIYVRLNRLSTLKARTGKQQVVIETEGGAKLEWTGTFALNPLGSTGHLKSDGGYIPVVTRYFEDVLHCAAPTGHSASELDYELATRADGALALSVSNADFVVNGLTLHQTGRQTPFLTLPEMRMTGGHLLWPEQIAGIGEITVDGLSVTAQRTPNGTLDIADMFAGSKKSPASPTPVSVKREPVKPWELTLRKFEFTNGKVRLDDHTLREPGHIDITNIALNASDLKNASGAEFPISFAMQVMPGGQIDLDGKLAVVPEAKLSAKFKISDLQLASAQPYLHDVARLKIADGRLNFETDLEIDGPERITASGRGEVNGLRLEDEVEATQVMSWDRIGVDQFEFSKRDNALRISQVAIDAPFLRFFVAKDRSTNFSHIAATGSAGEAVSPMPQDAPTDQGEETAIVSGDTEVKQTPLAFSVGKITVAKGSADYADESLPLPFAAHITGLQGDVVGLASDTDAPAKLDLHGAVGEFGELKVDGALTPFDPIKSTKIDLRFRNVEFPGLSPYTVKFAGQRIADGRLDVTLKYAIDAGKMEGSNRVVIRNIALGEKVDVPGAANLPLGLAIAVLKDRDGKIDIDLPVSGDVEDPKFALGGVIWKAVLNLLTNIVTAPFQALSGLAGGGAGALDHIDFQAGSADLAPPEKEKILQLAKALEQRPSLALIVPGAVDPDADRLELQFALVDAAMSQKLGDRNTIDRQRRFLERAYKDKIGKDGLDALEQKFTRVPQGQADGKPELDEAAFVAALREEVARAQSVGAAELGALADARAAAIVAALGEVPGFDQKRVSVRAGAEVKADEEGAVPLKLDATTVETSE